MRVAGVRLSGGHVVWSDARDIILSPLDMVEVLVDHEMSVGTVFVTPEQLVSPPAAIHGRVTKTVTVSVARPQCGDPVYGAMPPLGTRWGHPPSRGLVVGIDALKRLITVRNDDGIETQVALDDGAAADGKLDEPFADRNGGRK